MIISELSNDVNELKQLIIQLFEENVMLKMEIKKLKEQLNQNSNNSNNPPSSDKFKKKEIKPAISRQTDKKSGGQIGHKGTTLRKVEDIKVDYKIIHFAEKCPDCNKEFCENDVIRTEKNRQVFDIPEPKIEITEHSLGIVKCCGKYHRGAFPKNVKNHAQYGSRIKALAVNLNNHVNVPVNKIAELFHNQFGISMSEATILKANEEMVKSLESTGQIEHIKEQIIAGNVGYFDETGGKVAGKNHWFHIANNRSWSYIFTDEKRGGDAINSEKSVLPQFKNYAMHDCWGTYFQFGEAKHLLCNAHILRELQGLIENGGKWAVKMHEYLMKLWKMRNVEGRIWEKEEEKREEDQKFEEICNMGEIEEPKNEKVKGVKGVVAQSKGRNLLNRMVKYKESILAFASDRELPFSNNIAEQGAREVKTKLKTAMSFRTINGAVEFATIKSFCSSVRKQKINLAQSIFSTFNNKPVF